MSARPHAALTRVREAIGHTLSSARQDALTRLLALGLPTPRDDAFRYTNLRLLERRDLTPGPIASAQWPADLPVGADRLVIVNGRIDAATTRLPDSLEVVTTSEATDVPGDAVTERIRLWNAALRDSHTTLVVPRNARVALDVVMIATAQGAYPSLTLKVEAGAELTLIEYHVEAPGAAESVTAAVVDLHIDAGAQVSHTLVQCAAASAVLVADVRALIGRDATYRHRSAVLGAQLSRIDLTTQLQAPGASTALSGLFLADRSREHHLRTLVHHAAPNGTSQQRYRGVASERGRGSYDGKVVVDVGANGTNSAQSSKNLLLSSEATIETRPQLEINADAVKCAHGATTGSLDAQMLFYLLSRGLDRDTARAVLTYAFLGDVLTDFPTAVRRAVEARALGRLPAADLIRGFVA
jgi:Fe-S cluster assembly protein SufD